MGAYATSRPHLSRLESSEQRSSDLAELFEVDFRHAEWKVAKIAAQCCSECVESFLYSQLCVVALHKMATLDSGLGQAKFKERMKCGCKKHSWEVSKRKR